MNYFFQWVLGAGILDIGEAFVIASQIKDGDPGSWSEQFHAYGQALQLRAEQEQRENQHRSAGETFLKAFSTLSARPCPQHWCIALILRKKMLKAR